MIHGEIVDKICKQCGIETRVRNRSTVLNKKEAQQILSYLHTMKKLQMIEKGQENATQKNS